MPVTFLDEEKKGGVTFLDEPVGNPSAANQVLNNGILFNASPEQSAMATNVLTPQDMELETATAYYDLKFGTNHTPEMVAAQIAFEYGEDATPQVANQMNKKGAKWFKDVPEYTGRLIAGAAAQMPKLRQEMDELRTKTINRVIDAFGVEDELLREAIGGTVPLSPFDIANKAWRLVPADKLQKWGADQVRQASDIQSEYMSGVPLEKSFAEGDIETALSDIGTAIAFESPAMAIQIGMAMLSPEASAEFMFVRAAGAKRAEKDEGDTLEERVIAPIAVGAVEAATEKFLGTQRIVDKALKNRATKAIGNRFKQIITDITSGAVSEGGATFGENIIDRLSGEEGALHEGVLLSSIVGGVMDFGAGQVMTLGDATRIRQQNSNEQIDSMVQDGTLTPEQAEAVKSPTEQAVEEANRALFEPEVAEEREVTGEAVEEVVESREMEVEDAEEARPLREEGEIAEPQIEAEGEPIRRVPGVDEEVAPEVTSQSTDEQLRDEAERLGIVFDGVQETVDRETGETLRVAQFHTEIDGETQNIHPFGDETVEEALARTRGAFGEIAEPEMVEVRRMPGFNEAQAQEASDVIGLSTEAMNRMRRAHGSEEFAEVDRKAHAASMQNAIEKGEMERAEPLAQRVLESQDTKNPVVLTDEQVAGMGAKIAEIGVERDRLLRDQKAAMDAQDQDRIDDIRRELEQNIQRSDDLTLAIKTSATTAGRANSMMAAIINRFTYDVVGLTDAARTAKGENLTAEEESDLVDVAERIRDVEERIVDLKEQIKTGEFEETRERKRKDEPAELTERKRILHQLQREAREKIYNLRAKTLRDKIKNWATLPRTMMATADMSYGLRQGSLPTWGHPIIAADAWGKAFKSFFSQNTADEIDVAMREDPLYDEMIGYGTHFSSLDSAIESRTEFFASNLAEKIPVFGKVVQASERNMVTGINMLRFGLMKDFMVKHPDASLEAKRAYAKYINVATGRGEAKLLDKAAEELSLVFFAPRFAVSRVQAPFLAVQNMQHPELRGEMARQWAAYLGTGAAVLALAKMAGADVGDDPEDSDFGKIVIGKKRIDIWGGVQQPMRILAKAIKGGVERLDEGETDVDPINDIGRFLRYKLSPPMMMINELVSGRDIIGRETGPSVVGGVELPEPTAIVLKNMTPLIIQSAIESYNEGEDPAVIAALAAGEGLGLSIGVYEKKD